MRKVAKITAAVSCAVGVLVPVALACGGVRTSPEGPITKATDFVAGQLVVWFEDGVSAEEVAAAIAAVGGDVVERSAVTPGRVVLAVPPGEEDDYVAAYRKLDIVRAADKNYILRIPEGDKTEGTGPVKLGDAEGNAP